VTAPPADEILGGDPSARARGRLVAVVVVLALLAAGVVGVRWDQHRRLDALVSAAADAEHVIGESRTSLGRLYQYSDAVLSHPDMAPEQRAAVLHTFAVDAARYRPRVERPRRAVAGVSPLPWDDALRAARQAYLARVDAWTAAVDAGQTDPRVLLVDPPALRRSRIEAADALERAAGGQRTAALDALTALLRSQ
jgi:hypothetical protein